MRAAVIIIFLLLATSIAHALPPGGAARGLREGANHRLGDDSFVARFGRVPGEGDGEALRMATHLTYVRAWLGARPATRPELAEARARMLSYLDEYIAKGTTPKNTRLPWRSPVFIDEHGNICAVGYLIERSAGRAVAEQIAAAHRHDFLEDIAAARPAVRAWIEASGLSLEELASIQPGYEGSDRPEAEQWVPGRLASAGGEEGSSWNERGRLRRGQMHGAWTRSDDKGKVLGAGRLVGGAGTWHSTYGDGALLAQGPYVASRPHGTWRFFHRSGNLAAEGTFDRGWRHGPWTFFHDTKARTPIARGSFARNAFTGRWEHFDEAGALIASTYGDSPETWRGERGYVLTIVAGADRVRQQVHIGGGRRLHSFARGGERIYVRSSGDEPEVIFDADGRQLTQRGDGTWEASPCAWSRWEKRAARAGDVAQLHGLLARNGPYGDEVEHACGEAVAVPAERGQKLDELLAARGRVRAPVPAFVARLASKEQEEPEAEEDPEAEGDPEAARVPEAAQEAEAEADREADLAQLLAGTIDRHIDWPHVNGLFVRVYPTLAGERPWMNN